MSRTREQSRSGWAVGASGPRRGSPQGGPSPPRPPQAGAGRGPKPCSLRRPAAGPRPARGSPAPRRMRTRDAPVSSLRLADTRRSQNKARASGRARPRGRARRSLRTRAPPASRADQQGRVRARRRPGPVGQGERPARVPATPAAFPFPLRRAER